MTAHHDIVISARIAARDARLRAETVLSFTKLAHIRAAMTGADIEDLYATISAAITALQTSLEHLGATES